MGTAPEKASEEGGEDVDIGMGQAWYRVPPYGYLTDHHGRLTSKLRGSSLRGGHQYPHFTGRENEAHSG